MVKISQKSRGDIMENKSISDIIEAYLKEILGDSAQVEIRRSEIANQFDVVPSQINYVIKTRFTIQNGYLVKSKRGDSVRERDAFDIVRTLYEEDVITRREGDLMLVALSKQALAVNDSKIEDQLRARILVSFLNRLRYES